MKLGHDFGSTPFGTDLAAPPKADCVCEPDFKQHDIVDIACPQHGLVAFLRATFMETE